MKLVTILGMVILSLFVIACAPQETAEVAEIPEPEEEIEVEEPEPEVEEEEQEEEVEEVVTNIDEDVQALFDKAAEKTENLHYSYLGPDSDGQVYDVFLVDNLIRYVPTKSHKDPSIDEDAYNAIYLDTEIKLAEAHCDGQTCVKKGKIAPLSYNDYVIMTPFDWVTEITEAEKVGEERLNNRNAWKLDTNVGTVFIDTFTGIIMKIEVGEDEYEFTRIEQNTVKEEDIRP